MLLPGSGLILIVIGLLLAFQFFVAVQSIFQSVGSSTVTGQIFLQILLQKQDHIHLIASRDVFLLQANLLITYKFWFQCDLIDFIM